jgi:6,7-dimethyl-8-ribityllumazine synthase
VAVLLNCGESADQLLAQFQGTARATHAPSRGRMDLRSYGIGAQSCARWACSACACWARRGACPAWRAASAGSGRLHHQGLNMLEADKGRSAPLDGSGLRIGIVQARFNEGVTNGLRDACLAELAALGVKRGNIAHHTVPGALEVPLALRWLAHRGEYDALVALGCVIRGETYHFELVANESSAGITRVGLDLTSHRQRHPHHRRPAAGHRAPDREGRDAARVAVEMALLKPPSMSADPSRHAPATKPGTRKSSAKPPRSRAREFALQGLYQHLLGGGDAAAIDAFTRELRAFQGRRGALRRAAARLHRAADELDALIRPCSTASWPRSRPSSAPACGSAYEFQHCPDVPWRVVLNEASSWPRTLAAPTATSTSTACSTAWRPSCVRPRWAPTAPGRAPPGIRATTRIMRVSARAQRIEPFYVMEMAKTAGAIAREAAGSDRP